MCFYFSKQKKKWVGRAMGNETFYWDGQKEKRSPLCLRPGRFLGESSTFMLELELASLAKTRL